MILRIHPHPHDVRLLRQVRMLFEQIPRRPRLPLERIHLRILPAAPLLRRRQPRPHQSLQPLNLSCSIEDVLRLLQLHLPRQVISRSVAGLLVLQYSEKISPEVTDGKNSRGAGEGGPKTGGVGDVPADDVDPLSGEGEGGGFGRVAG